MSQDFAPSNPFRRSVLSRSDADTSRIDAVHVASVLDSTSQLAGEQGAAPTGDPTLPPVNSKTDQISSPSTPVVHERGLSIQTRPCQPFISDSTEASPTDPFDSASEDDDEEIENLPEDTRGDQPDASTKSHPSYEAIPLNPFRKVSDGADDRERRQPLDYSRSAPLPSWSGEASKHAPARISLDVDAFKRLILTGNAAGSAAASSANLISPQVQTHPQASPAADCGNSTDTSSISRQSIFEPTLDAQLDTPRTSHEISASDEERQRLVQDGSLSNHRKKKPPLPRTRHGKLIKDNGHLANPSSLSLPSLIPTDVEAITSTQLKPSTDLNKPLPPPPQTNTPESEIGDYGDAVNLGWTTESSSASQAHLSAIQRKSLLSPPVTRQRSQRSKISRENSTDESLLLSDTTPRGPSLDSFGSTPSPSIKAPPPPPIRRSVSVRSVSSVPAVPAVPLTPSVVPNPTDPLPASKSHNTAPPPPPVRSPSSSSAKRTPRRSSILGGAITSPPLPVSTAMAPPPPPPRQRGSSRSSLDNPTSSLPPDRTSGEFWLSSGGSLNRESGATLGQVPGATDGASDVRAMDILADLSALQKEVDELRGRYEKRTSSGQSA
ncbi:hypothetical protein GP486_001287 [Trichoglossum hirsutum]|uniref:Uncharacterized protein n=1 Tax=Trichoglossum hirsutum TaxID=265104 RepID=A0A9P8LGY8_9PEZI|nr:hypothetical protein GP486_001287 [Trichoglossum hirsutum]